MTTRPPAEIGMPLAEVDTPALLLDLDAFEANLDAMAAFLKPHGVALRAHAKTHKCPAVALQQMQRGAIGMCCQKVAEAEAMVEGGVPNVLVTNQIVGERKLRRLAALAKQATIGVCADHPLQVFAYGEVAREYGVDLGVLVEVDLGMRRCGLPPGEGVVHLARTIAETEGLHFEGLQAYQGNTQHIHDHDERRKQTEAGMAALRETRQMLEAAGLPCTTVSGSGTGTFALEAPSGLYTEMQAGSYAFMDVGYRKVRGADGGDFSPFRQSLFVLGTVISVPDEGHAVLDVGKKAHSVDAGLPWVHERPGVECTRMSDEHGDLALSAEAEALNIGDRVLLSPGHCDPTINLHDWYVGFRGDRVEALWPITARGPGF